ncbi:MAG TPA: iron-sulfur cluster repair di-iron protein [Puia sp.]|nr:iron-sulfur cluster repair di-iron protein [Puia sp.]
MNLQQCTVGEIVAQDARAAEIFERYKIDFCCNGNKTLREACGDAADAGAVENVIRQLLVTPAAAGGSAIDYRTWPLDLLADFIEKKYHRETTRQIGIIDGYLEKICRVHGQVHPELFTIKELFDESAADLTRHMQKEELMLFPYIRKMVQTGKPPVAPFGTVDNPIRALTHEHAEEGERFRKIAVVSDNYTVPADGCQTYRLTFQLLKDFESMLHIHIHLENNLLFPGALSMAEKT